VPTLEIRTFPYTARIRGSRPKPPGPPGVPHGLLRHWPGPLPVRALILETHPSRRSSCALPLALARSFRYGLGSPPAQKGDPPCDLETAPGASCPTSPRPI
jgi:hypothetical protein